jgi:hypothetical protein
MSGRHVGLLILGLAALAACQPLPHPFEDDRPPAALLRVGDVASVSVAPTEGHPSATAAKLSAAVADALQKRDIAASDKTTSLGSYQLYGRVVESRLSNGIATVKALWRLYDANGRAVGERTVQSDAKPGAWDSGDASPITQLANLSADGLVPLLQDEVPAAAKAAPDNDKGDLRTRVAIRSLSGAPGDGATSLSNAVAAILARQEIDIVDKGKPADLYLDGEITLTPVKPNKQHIKIVWHVKRADGAEIGTVGQENDIPRGLLDGPWGDTAYTVALAAGDGLMQLVARGAPEPKS